MAEGGPATLRQLRSFGCGWMGDSGGSNRHTYASGWITVGESSDCWEPGSIPEADDTWGWSCKRARMWCAGALRCLNWCARWKLSSVPFLIFEVQVGWPFCCLIPVGEKASELVQVPSIPRAITPRPLRRVPPAKLWPPKHSNAWQERVPCLECTQECVNWT